MKLKMSFLQRQKAKARNKPKDIYPKYGASLETYLGNAQAHQNKLGGRLSNGHQYRS